MVMMGDAPAELDGQEGAAVGGIVGNVTLQSRRARPISSDVSRSAERPQKSWRGHRAVA
jgi:hypothetical protein